MSIQPQFYVTLKGGKAHPTYPGVLDAATREGLRTLATDLIQAPTEENGHVAIVKARAVFQDEHGERVYEDYGDASVRNTTALVSTALIRMASTRAKGRVLRDGINLGETLAEEIPDGNGHDEGIRGEGPVQPRQVNQENGHSHPSSPPREIRPLAAGEVAACAECGLVLTPAQRTLSLRRHGGVWCPTHQIGKPLLVAIG